MSILIKVGIHTKCRGENTGAQYKVLQLSDFEISAPLIQRNLFDDYVLPHIIF